MDNKKVKQTLEYVVKDIKWDEVVCCEGLKSAAAYKTKFIEHMKAADIETRLKELAFSAWITASFLAQDTAFKKSLTVEEAGGLLGLIKKQYDLCWGEYGKSRLTHQELAAWEKFQLNEILSSHQSLPKKKKAFQL